MDFPDLRALSFGELLDRTFTYFRRHFWLFVAIMAVPQAVILVVTLAWEGFERAYLLHAAGTPSTAHGARFPGTAILGWVIVLVAYFVVYAVALGATTYAISEIHLGRSTTARSAYQRVRKRFWSLMGLIAAVAIRVFLVFLLLMIVVAFFPVLGGVLARNHPGFTMAVAVLLALVGYVVALVFSTRFAMRYGCTVPALLLENLRIGAAIKRSVALTKKQLGRVFLIGLLMYLVSWMVALVLEGPFLFAEMYMLIKHHTQPAFWLTACGGIMGAVGHAVTGPLLMIGLVLLYYDIRVRKEGFDLQVMMSALDAQSPVPGVPADPPLPAAPELEKSNVALLVILTLATFGLYYPIWFMQRRSGINSLRSREKLGVGVFVIVFALLALVLVLNVSRSYFPSLGINWLRVFDSMVWAFSGVLLLIESFKVRGILEAHAEGSVGGLFAGSINLAQESSLSGVATFFFGIFYLQHKINGMVEARAESQPDVGSSAGMFTNDHDQVSSGRPMRAGLLAAAAVCICGLCAIAFGQQKPAPVAPKPLSLPAYTVEIDRWVSNLDKLKLHPENAAALREQLPPSWPVTMGSERIEVPTGWLRTGLNDMQKDPKADSKDANRLISHLQAMKREARNLGESSAQDDASAHEKLNEILAMREFSGVHGPTWFDHLLQRIRRWLVKWVERLDSKTGSHQGIADFIFWVVLIFGGGGLLFWMVQRLLQGPGSRSLELRAPVAEAASSWEQLTREARRAAGLGEYRDAIRLAYWAAICRLDDVGLWTVDHTRTHREYLRLVKPDQPLHEPLATLTRQFEMAWYAARPSSANDFESAMSQLERLGCA
ncbi:MAG: DUF4129 domain-containing protein [Acidobacteriota bacterium]